MSLATPPPLPFVEPDPVPMLVPELREQIFALAKRPALLKQLGKAVERAMGLSLVTNTDGEPRDPMVISPFGFQAKEGWELIIEGKTREDAYYTLAEQAAGMLLSGKPRRPYVSDSSYQDLARIFPRGFSIGNLDAVEADLSAFMATPATAAAPDEAADRNAMADQLPVPESIADYHWDGRSVRDIERRLDIDNFWSSDMQRFQHTVPEDVRAALQYVEDNHPTNSIEKVTHSFQILAVDADQQALIFRSSWNSYTDAEGQSCNVVPVETAVKQYMEFKKQPLVEKVAGMLELLESDLRDIAEDRGTADLTCEFAGNLFFLAGADQELAHAPAQPGAQVALANELLQHAEVSALEELAEALNPHGRAPHDVESYVGDQSQAQPMPDWLRDAVDDFNAENSPAPRM